MYFACRFRCSEAMQLVAHLGYDGPVKSWVDGKKIFLDLKGTNPASPSKGKARFTAGSGDHEIVVALRTNNGMAWGIYLQLATALPKGKPAGKGCFALPELLG